NWLGWFPPAECGREKLQDQKEQAKCHETLCSDHLISLRFFRRAGPRRHTNDGGPSRYVVTCLLSAELNGKRGRFIGEIFPEGEILHTDRVVGLLDESLGGVVLHPRIGVESPVIDLV